VLIHYKLEVASADLHDLLQAGLEVLPGFALYAAILNEGSVLVSAILTGDQPNSSTLLAKFDGRAGSKPSLDFRLEVLEPHPVNGAL